jgi:hypothetical protein
MDVSGLNIPRPLKVRRLYGTQSRRDLSCRELIPDPIIDLVTVLTDLSCLIVGERIVGKVCRMDSCHSVQNPAAGLMYTAVSLLVLYKLFSFVTSRKSANLFKSSSEVLSCDVLQA